MDADYRKLLLAIPKLKHNTECLPASSILAWANWDSDYRYLSKTFHGKPKSAQLITEWAAEDPFYDSEGAMFGREHAIEVVLGIGLILRDHDRVHFTEPEESEKLPAYIQNSILDRDFALLVIKPLCVRFTNAIMESIRSSPMPVPKAIKKIGERPKPIQRKVAKVDLPPAQTTAISAPMEEVKATLKRSIPAPDDTASRHGPKPPKVRRVELSLLPERLATPPRKTGRYQPTPTDLERKLRSGSKKDSRK
jgi:hypothetical protein